MTYSQKIKEEMLDYNTKHKKCCIFSFIYGFMLAGKVENDNIVLYSTNVKNRTALDFACTLAFSSKQNSYLISGNKISIAKEQIRFSTIAEIVQNIFRCKKCAEYFLKGIFIAYASITDPEKSYRIDFNLGDFEACSQLKEYLVDQGLNAKISNRGEKYFVYLKRSEDVSDLLALCGCNSPSFEIINCRINKDIRNRVNRATNCDSANISKSISASQKYLSAINFLMEKCLIDSLPDNLKAIALLRIENPDSSFAELGRLANPTISKSGVFHRLEKVLEFYNKITENI